MCKDNEKNILTIHDLNKNLTKKTERVQQLIDRYVNIRKDEKETMTDKFELKSMTAQTSTVKMASTSV
jgi:hypothetical protein